MPSSKSTMRFGTGLPSGLATGRTVPPPTAVSLPVRDGLRTIDLPLNQAYEGLESLAFENSPSPSSILFDDDEPTNGSTSELSVVFKAAHHSERPPAPEWNRVPATRSLKTHPPRPPTHSSLPPARHDAYATDRLPEPPRLPGQITPPPPAPRAADFDHAADFNRDGRSIARSSDFDDDVDTMVMPSIIPADSLRPVEVRSVTVPPRGRDANRKPGKRASWMALAAACVFGGGAIAAGFVLLDAERGDLVIDVADQQCGSVDDVKVFVDDELACTSSPCTLHVSRGSHVVRAQADGYELTAPEAVIVDPDVPTLHRVQFGASTRTGIEVRSKLSGHTLYLDGKLIGELPQRVTGLTAGEHTILISAGEDYYAEERKIELKADELEVLEDIRLKPRSGTLRIAANDQLQRAVVTLDGERIQVPFEKQLDASKRYHLLARRSGFEDFETWVEFGADAREKDLNIQLMPGQSDSADTESQASRSESSESNSRSAAAGESVSSLRKQRAPSPQPATGQARLSLTSDPPSAVLLDGKPIGQTPKSVTVTPGSHSVLFVHPTKGRARATAKLAPGQSKTLRARF
jgi:serine/threonine-protein kinase